MKKTWRIINKTVGKTNQKNNLPMFIEHNDTLITDPNRISNTFNDYKYWIRFSVKYMCRRKQ